jgi:hypothetical protein
MDGENPVISQDGIKQVASSFFEYLPTEVTFIHVASCCARTTFLEAIPQSCGVCGTVVREYLRVHRDGEMEWQKD